MDEQMECLDRWHDDPCVGPVKLRHGLSPTGKWRPRCDKHWDERLKRQDEIDRRYPDSPIPPADFDPYYAGESWDEDY